MLLKQLFTLFQLFVYSMMLPKSSNDNEIFHVRFWLKLSKKTYKNKDKGEIFKLSDFSLWFQPGLKFSAKTQHAILQKIEISTSQILLKIKLLKYFISKFWQAKMSVFLKNCISHFSGIIQMYLKSNGKSWLLKKTTFKR